MGSNMGLPMSEARNHDYQVEDKMVPVMFNRIHTMNKPPRDEARTASNLPR